MIATATTSKTHSTSQITSGLSLPQLPAHLSLKVACAAHESHRSFIAQQYATYPFRLSNNLALAPNDPYRVYAYIMNAGPGLLAGDDLRVVVQVSDRASLYLTDQSATKVHSKPTGAAPAQITYALEVGNQAYLEYVPEPIIFFPTASLRQKTQISLHPQGRLVLSEIIVPGRLARGEFYAFEQFENRLQVRSPEGTLYLADRLKLMGQSNRFRTNGFLTDYPILGNFLLIAPELDLSRLSERIHAIATPHKSLQIGSSPVPNCHGLIIKAMATQTSILKHFQHLVIGTTRQLLNQPQLPKIPK